MGGERIAEQVAFVREALERGDWVGYVSGDPSAGLAAAALSEGGVAVETAMRRGALEILTGDPAAIVRTVRQRLVAARERGFAGTSLVFSPGGPGPRTSLPEILARLAGLVEDLLPGSKVAVDHVDPSEGRWRFATSPVAGGRDPVHWVEAPAGVAAVFEEPGRPDLRDLDVLRRVADLARIAIERDRADRERDEFLSVLGHELRNPLSAILASAEFLERIGGENADLSRRALQILGRQTAALSRTVNDLLDVSRAMRGRIDLALEPLDLQEVVERSLASLARAGRTDSHGIAFQGEPAVLEGDRSRLEQVVSVLIENAVDSTPGGGRIDVSVRAEAGEAVLRVADTGAGIEHDVLPRLFDFFAPAPAGTERPAPRLGIGLALVRSLVELHGGSIAGSSAGPSLGSEFVVRLPALRGASVHSLVEACVPDD